MVNYSATPLMTVELFRMKTAALGEIRFVKHWSVHHLGTKGVAADIRASFAAEITCDEATAPPVDKMVEKMKEVLIALSILTRQAITLHGWQWQKKDGLETAWFDPLQPNLAPDMAEEPAGNLCFPSEFEAHAQSLVAGFLAASADLKEVVTFIVGGTRTTYRKTDRRKFLRLVQCIGAIAGLAKSVEASGPSFKLRFEKFVSAYPTLRPLMSDLWPLMGTQKVPGLKQMRDSLAHGLRQEYSV